jgi:hypothetical protein
MLALQGGWSGGHGGGITQCRAAVTFQVGRRRERGQRQGAPGTRDCCARRQGQQRRRRPLASPPRRTIGRAASLGTRLAARAPPTARPTQAPPLGLAAGSRPPGAKTARWRRARRPQRQRQRGPAYRSSDDGGPQHDASAPEGQEAGSSRGDGGAGGPDGGDGRGTTQGQEDLLADPAAHWQAMLRATLLRAVVLLKSRLREYCARLLGPRGPPFLR